MKQRINEIELLKINHHSFILFSRYMFCEEVKGNITVNTHAILLCLQHLFQLKMGKRLQEKTYLVSVFYTPYLISGYYIYIY